MGSTPQFTAQTETRNGVSRIALIGELDMATVSVLTERLTHVEHDGVSAIMLDLRDLDFLDLTGLDAFLQAHDRAKMNGHRLALMGLTPSTRRLFALTGTEYLFDEREAVSLLGRFAGPRREGGSRELAWAKLDGDD